MPKRPSLALARWIVKSFRYDDFILGILHGTPRIGKSAYAVKVMGQVVDYFFGEDIYKITGSTGHRRAPICQKYLGWDPAENVETWLDIFERIPCFTWDDAGYWLFSLNWTAPLLISSQQYMNVIGTDMNTLLLTTPDPTWILSKIATMPGTLRVKIIKRRGGNSDADSIRFARRAIGYKPWVSPDLKSKGVNKVLSDEFSCKLPDEFYNWYKPTREKYAKVAKLAMRAALRAMAEKARAKAKGKKKRGRPPKKKD